MILVMSLAPLLPAPVLAHGPIVLADPGQPIASAWEEREFGARTEFQGIVIDGVRSIRAIGRNSASGLYREVAYGLLDHPLLQWDWRVDRLQSDADLRRKETEDFGAAIILIFGTDDVSPWGASALAYVWTNDRLATGSIVSSPHHPDNMRSIVVESGKAKLGQWSREERDVVADYRAAYGRQPPAEVSAIALFTDNDQTGQPVESYYGAVRALMQ
jgi:hypothetical protein